MDFFGFVRPDFSMDGTPVCMLWVFHFALSASARLLRHYALEETHSDVTVAAVTTAVIRHEKDCV